MSDRVVVPVDGSAHSLDAVVAGSRLADAVGARLETVAVVAPRADADAVRDHLTGALEALDGVPVEPALVVLTGDVVADAVAQYVADGPPTRLVMSSTGRGRSAALLGSVAEELLAVDVGPIVVLGPHASDDALLTGDVLVTLDGSALSECALDAAVDWGAGRGSRFWVASVIDPEVRDQLDPDVAETGYVSRAARRLADRLGRSVEYEVLHHPDPARAIVDFADQIDAGTIVMSTHGRTGIRRAVVGSVTADVIRHAPCAVLVTRPPTEVIGHGDLDRGSGGRA